MICIGYFDIYRCGLVQVLGCIVLLGPEYRAYLIDLFKSRSHHYLFIKLRALVEKRLLVKVGNREQLGPALCCGCNDLGSGNIDESLLIQVLVDGVHCRAADLENCSDPGSPGIKEPGIKPGVEISRDLLHNIEREGAVGKTDDLKQIRYELASARSLVNCLHYPRDPHNG